MQRYISIDCATKSIAISVIEYNNKAIDLKTPETLQNLNVIKTITRNLAPNRQNGSIGEVERVSLVHLFIKNEIETLLSDTTIILLEKQIATTPTYICYITLMALFIEKNIKVITIAPTYKNQLVFGEEKIGKYLQMYSTSYEANKQHSKSMSRLIVPHLSNHKNVIFDKKMETDFADSLCQLIAFISLKLYL